MSLGLWHCRPLGLPQVVMSDESAHTLMGMVLDGIMLNCIQSELYIQLVSHSLGDAL